MINILLIYILFISAQSRTGTHLSKLIIGEKPKGVKHEIKVKYKQECLSVEGQYYVKHLQFDFCNDFDLVGLSKERPILVDHPKAHISCFLRIS